MAQIKENKLTANCYLCGYHRRPALWTKKVAFLKQVAVDTNLQEGTMLVFLKNNFIGRDTSERRTEKRIMSRREATNQRQTGGETPPEF